MPFAMFKGAITLGLVLVAVAAGVYAWRKVAGAVDSPS